VPHSDAMRTQSPRSVGLRSLASPIVLARLAGLATLASIAGCVPPPRAEAPPPRTEAPAPAPAPRPVPIAADWRDWPYTPGTWTYRRDPRGSVASFGPQAAQPVLTLQCDTGTRQVYLSRTAVAATPMTIRTSSVTRALSVQSGNMPGTITATLPASDPLLEAMGFSRGRFVIDQQGQPALVIPAWAEIERVTEDCRG